MTSQSQYDENNIFARILRGEIPCHKIYEDDETLAFMDVMPQSIGHALVVPKRASRNLLDAEESVLGPLMKTAQRIGRASKKAFSADGIMVVQYNEPAAGQTVFHLHVHVIPRFAATSLKAHSDEMAKDEILSKHASMISAAMLSPK
jgi:histidine triad (HIT) family protein